MKAERVTLPDEIVVSDGAGRCLAVRLGECQLWEWKCHGMCDKAIAASIDDARALRDMLIAAISDYEQKGPRT